MGVLDDMLVVRRDVKFASLLKLSCLIDLMTVVRTES